MTLNNINNVIKSAQNADLFEIVFLYENMYFFEVLEIVKMCFRIFGVFWAIY